MDGLGESDAAERIIGSVIEIIQSEGYDAVQLRSVAKRARVSLATIYARYSSRDELVLAAVESWMAENSYVELAPPHPDETLAEGMMRLIRAVFQPWEHSPQMARAFYHARASPDGQRLDRQGFEAVLPATAHLLDGLDRDYVTDLALVMINICYAMVGRLVEGSADVAEVLSSMERVARRMTSDNSELATHRSASDPTTPSPKLDFTPFSAFGPAVEAPDQRVEPSVEPSHSERYAQATSVRGASRSGRGRPVHRT